MPIRPQHWESSSSLSFARSLFHAAEAKELLHGAFIAASAVEAYYSLFHLGASLILAYCSLNPGTAICRGIQNKLEDRQKERTKQAPQTGCCATCGASLQRDQVELDPSEGIAHRRVPEFLANTLIGGALGGSGVHGTLMDMREFVSYAPRSVRKGVTVYLWSGCHYTPEEFSLHLQKHLTQITEFFFEALHWLKAKSCSVVRKRLLTIDFVLHEFDALSTYHNEDVRK